ncbi:MAG: tripartite tricarboxylate transporter TctB family protein [Pseudomonadota bacterium]
MADRVIFVCSILIVAVYFYATAQIPSLEIGDPLGPKAFPRLLGIALLFAAGLLFFEILQARKLESANDGHQPREDRGHYVVVGAVLVWTAVYLAVFEWLGYVIATTVYLLTLMVYFHKGKWLANVLTSVLFCVITYVLFTKVLGVTLARGLLPF